MIPAQAELAALGPAGVARGSSAGVRLERISRRGHPKPERASSSLKSPAGPPWRKIFTIRNSR